MEFIHVFLMMLYIGTGEERRLVSSDMYFASISECNWFAKEAAKRFTTHAMVDPRDKATAYCVPKYVREGTPGINIY